MIRWLGYDELIQGGFGEPNPDNYLVVYDDQIETNDFNAIFRKFNLDIPLGYLGHSLSISDVIELYDEEGSTFYYVDSGGFRRIDFKKAS